MKPVGLRGSLSSSFLVLSLVLLSLNDVGSHPAITRHGYYMDPSQADLAQVLPPPPRAESVEAKADLQEVLTAERHRTKHQISEALADSEESVFRFADVMGAGFNAGNLPYATGFFERLSSDADDALIAAKLHFNRPRPFAAGSKLKPLGNGFAGPSYPSGHATFAYLNAIVLSYMVPEKMNAIHGRASEYACNRVILGLHYPSDTEAGLISASVIANVLLHQPAFLADLARARSEVRIAIGLSP